MDKNSFLLIDLKVPRTKTLTIKVATILIYFSKIGLIC